MFDINFHLSWLAPLSVVKHFSLKKFSQRIVFFTRARNRGEYGGTTVSGRIPTKWCSHLSERKFSFFVAFQSLKKIFGKLTQSLTMCWCLMISWPKQQIVLSFAFCLPKGGIEMLVWYYCYKICFQRENLKRTSAGMPSTWLFSKVLAIENKSVSLRNECLTKIARDSCQLIFKKRKERLVLSSLTIAQTRRVISKYWVTFSALVVDIRLLTAPQNRSKQSKRQVTRKTFPAKRDQQ